MSEEYEVEESRKKRNGVTRQFGCPCGKYYLSYPALFTHVKQKHNSIPPGQLIKPKNQKTRGRPKLDFKPNFDEEIESINLMEEIQKILKDSIQSQYNEPYLTKEGNKTCQNMGTIFLQNLTDLPQNKIRVVKCFLNEVKYNVDQKFGTQFWEKEEPNDIIELANQMCHKHKTIAKNFPLRRKVFVSLMFLLFKWMFINKWTNHRLNYKRDK